MVRRLALCSAAFAAMTLNAHAQTPLQNSQSGDKRPAAPAEPAQQQTQTRAAPPANPNEFSVTQATFGSEISLSPTVRTFLITMDDICNRTAAAECYPYLSRENICLFNTTGPGCKQIDERAYPRGGLMLSLPRDADATALMFPLSLTYQPFGAKIESVQLRLFAENDRQPREPRWTSPNLLAAIGADTTPADDGLTVFPKFYIPATHLAPFAGRVFLSLRATARLPGQRTAQQSDREIAIDGLDRRAVFAPLFNAGETTLMRYGASRDLEVGGDGWAQADVIQWLQARSPLLYFNDITALHAARYPRVRVAGGATVYRSLLGHDGHHNGRQIDLRYSSGLESGAETEDAADDVYRVDDVNLSGRSRGAAIRNLLQRAADAGAEGKPAPVLAVSWVQANRRLMESAGDRAEHIYAGTPSGDKGGLIFDALTGDARSHILTSWVWRAARSDRVTAAFPHDDHWHMNLGPAPQAQPARPKPNATPR